MNRPRGRRVENVSLDVIEKWEDIDDIVTPIKRVFGLFFLTMAIIGNGIIFYSMLRRSSTRTLANLFLINIIATDLVYSLANLVGISSLLGGNDNKCFHGSYLRYVRYLLYSVSMLSLTALNVERYFIVNNPVFAKTHSTKRFKTILLIVIWVVSILLPLPLIFYCHGIRRKEGFNLKVYAAVQTLILYVIPVIVVITTAVLIQRSLNRRIDENELELGVGASAQTTTRANQKAMRLLVAIATLFILCWTPMQFIILRPSFSRGLSYEGEKLVSTIAGCTRVFSLSFPAFCPILYLVFSTPIRKATHSACWVSMKTSLAPKRSVYKLRVAKHSRTSQDFL